MGVGVRVRGRAGARWAGAPLLQCPRGGWVGGSVRRRTAREEVGGRAGEEGEFRIIMKCIYGGREVALHVYYEAHVFGGRRRKGIQDYYEVHLTKERKTATKRERGLHVSHHGRAGRGEPLADRA